MNHLTIVISLLFSSLAWVACEDANNPGGNGGLNNGTECVSNKSTSTDANLCTDKDKDKVDARHDNPVPSFDEVDPGSRFNRSALNRANMPNEYKEKIFVAKRVPFHRAIWMDLTKEVWASWNRFEQAVDNTYRNMVQDDQVADYILRFAQNRQDYHVDQVSIHQPLKLPTFLPKTDELVFNFYTVGHVAVPYVDKPQTKTLVLGLNPFLAQENMNSIAKPEDYTLVYQHVGTYADTLVKECDQEFKSQAAGNLPNIEILTKCQTILKGLTNYTFNSTTYEANNAFDELFKKQSIAIWDPVCPKNYKAIGQVTTNGRTDKPFTENDFSQNELDILTGKIPGISPTLRAAMYCIKKDYVVAGKLGQPIISNGEVTIYQILPADEKGYTDSNLFHAEPGSPNQDALNNVEVWVLSKEHAILLEDEDIPVANDEDK